MFKYICSIIVLFSISVMSPVDIADAEILVNRFISNKNLNESFQIQSIDNQSYENLFIIELSPEGFIIISSDNRSRPILGYSFNNNIEFICS